MKGKKFVILGVSGILVVGVIIGVIVSVNNNNNHSKSSSSSNSNDVLSTTSKSVAAICSPTEHKQACVASLSSVANNQSATPQDFIQAAIQFAIQEVKSALSNTPAIGKAANDSLNKMAVEDCKELLQYAINELQASYSMVGDPSMHTIEDREAELLNWLSAVGTYQEMCRDGFNQPDLKNAMSNGLLNATQLTDNALSIVAAMSQIFTAFNIPINTSTSTSTRHLQEVKAEAEFPAWFSGSDRRQMRQAHFNVNSLKPNAVVAKDGSGQYKTINEALAAYPKNLNGRYVIYVKAGIYNENVKVTVAQKKVFMYGDGPQKTIVTGRKSFAGGITTFNTATFTAIGDDFVARSMGFENTAGPEGHQAVALLVQSDRSAFYNCRMDGYQDTLYVSAHRQFYRNCHISGTVDFIFGDSSTIIQNSVIQVRKPMAKQKNTVTAQGRKRQDAPTALVIQNCQIVPEPQLFPERFQIPTYLGRPWKMYSRTVIMESTLADFVQPAGWLEWDDTGFALNTLSNFEYANKGPGAGTDKRVKWPGVKVIDRNEALKFTTVPLMQSQRWLRSTGTPYVLALAY